MLIATGSPARAYSQKLENFSEAWTEKPAGYGKFVKFIERFLSEVRALPSLTGPPLDEMLKLMFGERVVGEAREAVTKQFREKAQAGQIRSIGRRLTGVAGAGAAIRSHKFYGDDDGEA